MIPWFNMQDNHTQDLLAEVPDVLPILPLRNTVAYPYIIMPLAVAIPRSVKLIEEVERGNRLLGLVAVTDPTIEIPGPDDVYRTGTVAIVHRVMRNEDGNLTVFIQGLERMEIDSWTASEPYLKARIHLAPDVMDMVDDPVTAEALRRALLEITEKLTEFIPQFPEEALAFMRQLQDLRLLTYLLASNMHLEVESAQRILEEESMQVKMELLVRTLTREYEVRRIGQQIQEKAKEEIEKNQREYYLRQQMQAIQSELGEADDSRREAEEYRKKIESCGMTEEAKAEALREVARLEKMPPQAAEYWVIKTYLDWLTSLPWQSATEDNLDIAHARQVLDEDHYDLQDVKERILEFLAVRRLKQERGENTEAQRDLQGRRNTGVGAILAFIGPPGVGKTSLGQSIARALGRHFIRMSLGGMRDEAEIRGHRRTYIGAMPGRIMQSIKRSGVKNPVFMLDEVDKIGTDWRGDPSSALLEVLDPQQNHTFHDHYLDVDFDLSEVLFICTANTTETIPAPLLDRMEIIYLDGYTEYEKLHITRNYLIPRQLEAHSLRAEELSIPDAAIRRIIRDYTREAGVRQLEREIGKVCRKVATRIAEGTQNAPLTVEAEQVPDYLGKPRYRFEAALRTERPGVATGLAWTPSGGEVLFVEAARMPGQEGTLILTGHLGDVMRESARIALSFVEAHATELGLSADDCKGKIHLHVPAGAVPKDGPSAGVTMVTALVSLLTGRPVLGDVGMTGEITLQGQVLPIGGVKQKVLAAHRAGLKKVILPRLNAVDLDELPEEIRKDMEFVLVDDIFTVLEHALPPAPQAADTEQHQETSA